MTHTRLIKKLLLIGWDAADWQIINPLIKSGKMPTLARLIKNGVSGNLATIQPILSPMLWTSIATGKRADKHGIHGFVEPTPDSSTIQPASSQSRKCKALWNILNQNNLTTNIINWFASHPAEPINGAMVSNLLPELKINPKNPETIPAGTLHPPTLAQTIAPLHLSAEDITPEDIIPFIPLLKQINLTQDNRPKTLAALLARASSTLAITTELMRARPWDLTAVYFPAIDHFGHHFMAYHPPKMATITKQDFDHYRYVIETCYRFHDSMLKTLLQYAGEDTTTLIISDHGYHSGRHRPPPQTSLTQPESWHRPIGIACLHGTGIKKNDKLYGATILDITPTILNLFGLPAAIDMDGRSWQETFSTPNPIPPIFSWELKTTPSPPPTPTNPSHLKTDPNPSPIQPATDSQTAADPQPAIDPETALNALQQLADLGYINPPGEHTQKRVRAIIQTNKTNLIRALMDSLRISKAIPLLHELQQDQPEETWHTLALAQCHLRLNQLQQAQNHLDQLPLSQKQSPRALLLNAELALKQNQPATALRHLQQAETIAPDTPQLHHKLGQVYTSLNQLEQAETTFKHILKKDPDDPLAHNGRAHIFIQRKQYEQAIESALEAVGLLHFFPEAHYHLALALALSGREEQAIAAFTTCEKLIGASPPSISAWLAKLYQSSNRNPAKAKAYLAKIKTAQQPSSSFFFTDNNN